MTNMKHALHCLILLAVLAAAAAAEEPRWTVGIAEQLQQATAHIQDRNRHRRHRVSRSGETLSHDEAPGGVSICERTLVIPELRLRPARTRRNVITSRQPGQRRSSTEFNDLGTAVGKAGTKPVRP